MRRTRLGQNIEQDIQKIKTYLDASGVAGDHGALGGLGDDDHSQYMHVSIDRTVTAQHDFAPTSVTAPFTLGANAQGVTVGGLQADHLDKSITAGYGLTGGGVLTADRSLAVDASSDPGANQRVLESTAAGGLTLQSLTVEGNVDITSGGDLTVGANILFVDASGSNIGINTAPDPQFDLDVAGNLRAQGWIVGKHAIQLEGALMICHYDGPEPYTTNFIGEPTGHRGQTASVSGGVIYRQGKFLKAVQIAEGMTNLVEQPSFEGSISNWSSSWSDTIAASTDFSQFGTKSLKITQGGGDTNAGAWTDVDTGDFGTYTISAWFYVPSSWDGNNPTLRAYEGASFSNLMDTSSAVTERDEWVHRSITVTSAISTTIRVAALASGSASNGSVYYIDGVQLIESDHVVPYGDGSMGAGHSWAGTAHDSGSTRTTAVLTYETSGNIRRLKGTIMLWSYVGRYDNTSNRYLFSISPGGASPYPNTFALRRAASSDEWQFWTVDASGNESMASVSDTLSEGWHHFAVTWTGQDGSATTKLYIDGELQDTVNNANMPASFQTDMYIGMWSGGSDTLKWNSWIDDLVILDRVSDADEITSVYESDAPVFAETSTWSWRDPTTTIWVDGEGLFARDQAGNVILGLSTVDSKSWGGITLDAGDFLIGNDSDGYLKWDHSAARLSIDGYVDNLFVVSGGEIGHGDPSTGVTWSSFGASATATEALMTIAVNPDRNLNDARLQIVARDGASDSAFAEVIADGNENYLAVQDFIRILDGISYTPSVSGPLASFAAIYVDDSDGDLKVRFGDGTTKTIATD